MEELQNEGPSRALQVTPGGNSGGDRLKRDEWSEGAVACLLEAYESKWVLRNRAKLKGQDWEDVAREVSSRAAGSAKTATQCKNKIESMKKRYRNEVAAGGGSRWPLFPKLDGLVRCRGSMMPAALVIVDESPAAAAAAAAAAGAQASQSAEPNGVVAAAAAAAATLENHTGGGERLHPTETNRESDENAPSCDSSKENQETRKKEKRKRAKEEGREVVESIQWLAEVVLRVEQAKLEAMREGKKIRAEAEARKGELELKRTEIIANTQLQIAKLLARSSEKVISSPRIGKD